MLGRPGSRKAMTRRPPATEANDPADPSVMDGSAWTALCDTLRASTRLVATGDFVDPRARAEGLRYLTRLFAAGTVVCMEHADPDYPEFGRMIDHRMKWGLDAPDCLYLYASVRGDALYRIGGWRGTANHIDFQVNHGHFADGDIAKWGTVASLNGLEMDVAADGTFELLLGPDCAGRNALRIAPGAEFVLVRQYFADWEGERPADLTIERVGAQYPPPPLRTDEVAARLGRLEQWVRQGGALWDQMSKTFLAMEPNTLVVHLTDLSDQRAGLRGQAYGIGNFACLPDEAVIVEFVPPPCRHWSVSLANRYWESVDFTDRQGSLNAHQAVLDRDGAFRAVISHQDPGVANWLDPDGLSQGSIVARFLLADHAPTPRLRRLPFAALGSELPTDTARVSPGDRKETLARRRQAVLRRYRR
jgi:hypothetical protein